MTFCNHLEHNGYGRDRDQIVDSSKLHLILHCKHKRIIVYSVEQMLAALRLDGFCNAKGFDRRCIQRRLAQEAQLPQTKQPCISL